VLIPLGSFFNNLQSGGFELPWLSIAGLVDVMAVMFTAIWLLPARHLRVDLGLLAGALVEAFRDPPSS
jgi:hypothetical protein